MKMRDLSENLKYFILEEIVEDVYLTENSDIQNEKIIGRLVANVLSKKDWEYENFTKEEIDEELSILLENNSANLYPAINRSELMENIFRSDMIKVFKKIIEKKYMPLEQYRSSATDGAEGGLIFCNNEEKIKYFFENKNIANEYKLNIIYQFFKYHVKSIKSDIKEKESRIINIFNQGVFNKTIEVNHYDFLPVSFFEYFDNKNFTTKDEELKKSYKFILEELDGLENKINGSDEGYIKKISVEQKNKLKIFKEEYDSYFLREKLQKDLLINSQINGKMKI